MIDREFSGDWSAGCPGAPPPLHVSPDNPQAAWYPVPRMVLRPQPPGPYLVCIPVIAPFGDDPLDPAAQTAKRIPTNGMIGWLNPPTRGPRSIKSGSVRQ